MSFESCEYNTAARGGDKARCSVHRHVQTAAHLSWHGTYPVGPAAAVEPADLLYTPSTRPNATPTNCIHTNYSRQHLHQLHRHLGIPAGTTHSRYTNIPRSHYVTNLDAVRYTQYSLAVRYTEYSLDVRYTQYSLAVRYTQYSFAVRYTTALPRGPIHNSTPSLPDTLSTPSLSDTQQHFLFL